MTIHSEFKVTYKGEEVPLDRLSTSFPEVAQFIQEWKNEHTYIQLQTSGSTGVPKKVVIEKSVMWHSAGATLEALDLDRPLRALLALSASYVAGKMMLVRAMRGGWTLELAEVSSNVLATVEGEFAFTALVPMQVESGIDHLHKYGVVIIGGAPVGEGLRQKLTVVDAAIYETYGMTETVSHIAIKKIEKGSSNLFRALPGVHFSADENDCLVIHAPAWNQANLKTTDVIEWVSPTTFRWLGRADFVINSGGVKIHPEEVESAIARELEMHGYLVGVPDETLGMKAVLVLDETPNTEMDFGFLKPYHRPKEVVVIPAFPRTSSDKIDRRALAEHVRRDLA